MIGLVSGGHFFSHFYGLSLPPLFPILKDEFDVSYAALGLLLACYALIGGLAQGVVGFLVDRFGARYVLLLGLGLNAAAIAAMGFAPSFPALLLLAVLAGLGNSVFHPADYAILSDSVSPRRTGRAFSIHTFFGFLGSAAAPVTLVVLDAHFGWRNALIGAGLLGLFWLVVVASQGTVLRNDRCLRAKRATKRAADVEGVEKRGLALLFSPVALLLFAFFVATEVALVGIFAFSVSALNQLHGTTLGLANAALTSFLFAGAVGVLAGGFVADRVRHHDRLAALVLGAAAAFILPSAVVSLGSLALLPLFAAAGFAMGAAWPARDMMVRAVTPSGESGKVFGFLSMGLSVGGSAAPLAFGWFLDIGQASWVFLFAVFFTVVALLTALAVGRLGESSRVPLRTGRFPFGASFPGRGQ